MSRMEAKKIIDGIAAAIRIGGTAVSIGNPAIGIGVIGVGELIPLIADKVNNKRKKIFINTINIGIGENAIPFDSDDNIDVYSQILDTVRKVILSESDYTIYLMGKITSLSIKDNRKYTQSELQLIDSLYRMNDYDFVNFMHICNQFERIGKKSGDAVLIEENDIQDSGDSNKDNIVYTLKKLNSMNLFDYCSTAMFEEDDGTQTYCSANFYKMNSLTIELIKLIESE